jgi:solute carrier family 25 (mitochondrial folate transporter), member 32
MPGLDDPFVINVVAGGIAGAATAVFVCPLDVLKTRMQVQSINAGQLGYNLRGEVPLHHVERSVWLSFGIFDLVQW